MMDSLVLQDDSSRTDNDGDDEAFVGGALSGQSFLSRSGILVVSWTASVKVVNACPDMFDVESEKEEKMKC